MAELETLQAELAEKQKRIKEIEARIASIEGTDRLEAKPIKAWVATDEDGWTCIFENKPIRKNEEWYGDTSYEDLWDKLPFKYPTWEDEPVEVEITIKKV